MILKNLKLISLFLLILLNSKLAFSFTTITNNKVLNCDLSKYKNLGSESWTTNPHRLNFIENIKVTFIVPRTDDNINSIKADYINLDQESANQLIKHSFIINDCLCAQYNEVMGVIKGTIQYGDPNIYLYLFIFDGFDVNQNQSADIHIFKDPEIVDHWSEKPLDIIGTSITVTLESSKLCSIASTEQIQKRFPLN